jgi:hypothetical protein
VLQWRYNCITTVVIQWCPSCVTRYNCVTVVSKLCYSGVTTVLPQWCPSDNCKTITTAKSPYNTVVLNWCYSGVAVLSQLCRMCVTGRLQWCYNCHGGVTVELVVELKKDHYCNVSVQKELKQPYQCCSTLLLT